MSTDQDIVAGRIARLLEQGKELPEPVLARLHEARQKALQHQRIRQGMLALPGGLHIDFPWLARFVAPLVLVLAAALVYYQSVLPVPTPNGGVEERLAELDARMLSTDLPLDAYLDQDFPEWVYAPPQQ